MNNYENKYYKPIFSIGEAAKKVGLSVQMLRLYEAMGLIIPHRKSSLHRLYSESDIERIYCIRKMITQEKISINGIKHILALIPCWAIKNCSRDSRQNCKAYYDSSQPCWLHHKNNQGCENTNCRMCPVYTDILSCDKLKFLINKIV